MTDKKDKLIEKLKEFKEYQKGVIRALYLRMSLTQGEKITDAQSKYESEIIALESGLMPESKEIEHGIPFQCPECGELIQYGLSEKGYKLFAKSKLFNPPIIEDRSHGITINDGMDDETPKLQMIAEEFLFSKYPLVSKEWFKNNDLTQEMIKMMSEYAEYASQFQKPLPNDKDNLITEIYGIVKNLSELNMCNYNEDQVRTLNNGMIEVFTLINNYL